MAEKTEHVAVRLLKKAVGLPTGQSSCCGPAVETPRADQSSCCGPAALQEKPARAPEQVHAAVRERYGAIARTRDAAAEGCGCSAPSLYSDEQLADVPVSVAELSLGCGNPVSEAEIREGDTVVDLGAGGGIDCFLAAKRVGPTGHVIGVDMTPEMLERARASAARLQAHNVEFRLGQIEALPVADGEADVVISNCVINLSPDKPRVFREMFRALKPGGRVSVSDIVTNGPMNPLVEQTLDSWAGCVAGASQAETYCEALAAAGFVEVQLRAKEGALNTLAARVPAGMPFSALVSARKPGG